MVAAKKVIFDKKNILVIGGAGFIGSHLCDELIKTSKIICVDNYSSGSVNNIAHLLQDPNFIFLRHDITTPLRLESFPELEVFQMKFQGVQEIYYLACPTIKQGFEEYRIATAAANSLGVMHGLSLAHIYDAKFLFASTHSMYGDPLEGQKSFHEDYWGFVDALSERACYNEGKRFGETLTMAYHRAHHVDVKIARIFNTYGPRMRLAAGRQIPDFVLAAVNHQDLKILGDGTREDSYCYISDMIQGLVALMRSTANVPVNLGNPVMYKTIDIARTVIKLVGAKSNVVFSDALVGLVRSLPPDIARARQLLGWFPVTDIQVGLQRTIDDMMGAQVLTYQPPLQQMTG